MSLGLSHSLSRHKLKFSPDKVDTMIVQAIALLDDLDKELNTYAMRVKEWYGWHFPEMGRIVNDNLAYARVILKMGLRSSASSTDLADVLPEEIEEAVKAAAEISMGTEITIEDLENIQALAEQVVGFTEYRQQLSSYLSARMAAIAPNLTVLVGELVGARLIAHAGSLINLAKSPASTIQILGAEKALFRALKTKHDTPKYGLIYHASLVGQATGKNKGKIARMVATKAAIGLRVDALTEWGVQADGEVVDVPEEERAALGIESRMKIERRLRSLEGKPLAPRGVAIGPNGMSNSQPSKWEIKEARKYNADADGLAGNEPAAAAISDSHSGRSLPTYANAPEIDRSGDVKMIEEIEETNEADDDDEKMDDDADHDGDLPNRQSGNTEDEESSENETEAGQRTPTKKSRKAERKASQPTQRESRKEERDTKIERRLARQERRAKKGRESGLAADRERYDADAASLGLSSSRFRKKLNQGEIIYGDDGKPLLIDKGELKAAKKAKKFKKATKDESRAEARAARAAEKAPDAATEVAEALPVTTTEGLPVTTQAVIDKDEATMAKTEKKRKREADAEEEDRVHPPEAKKKKHKSKKTKRSNGEDLEVAT